MDAFEAPALQLKKTRNLLYSLVAVPFIGLVGAGWKALGSPQVEVEAFGLPLFVGALLFGLVGFVGLRLWEKRAVAKAAEAHGLDPVELRMRAGIH